MKLVNLTNYGIKGINYYWVRKDQFNLTEDELQSVGIEGNDALVDLELVPKLKEANEIFKSLGFEIIVKDAYRSPEVYKLVQKKRYENDGKEITDSTLNVKKMPHSTGLTVDINLLSLETGEEIETWDKKDWPEGSFIDFYRNKKDAKSKEYQRLQDLLINTMLKIGFKLGSKKEYWHFEYEPQSN